ncbi:hypothetical protein CBS101457_006064 [Exobasidium rhododendri]|nr:hypothetical protein CBS101457_006064 [Exobasidium rhododendri]
MIASTALVALALIFASDAVAVPVLQSRDVSNCTSLGKGPLGYNASNIGIYNYNNPGFHLTFNGTQSNRYGDDYLLANPAFSYDNPEFFELFSCLHTPPLYAGKGSIDVYQGYIQTSDGDCVQRTSIDTIEGQFSKKPCAYNLDDLTGDSAAQHFQFSLYSFYSFYSVVFLGTEQGPTADANTSFSSGGNYQSSLVDLPGKTQLYIESDYQAGAEQEGDSYTSLIAHLGSQYKPTQTNFPSCTLVKNGTLTLTNGTDTSPVSLSSVSYGEYESGLALTLNGTQSSQGFEFYQCDSDYMGYEIQASSTRYGHLLTSQDTYFQDCFLQAAGVNNGTIFSSTDYDGCGTKDDDSQLSTFFSYDEEGGEILFLGARASETNTNVYSWGLQGDQVVLSTTPTAYTLRYT